MSNPTKYTLNTQRWTIAKKAELCESYLNDPEGVISFLKHNNISNDEMKEMVDKYHHGGKDALKSTRRRIA